MFLICSPDANRSPRPELNYKIKKARKKSRDILAAHASLVAYTPWYKIYLEATGNVKKATKKNNIKLRLHLGFQTETLESTVLMYMIYSQKHRWSSKAKKMSGNVQLISGIMYIIYISYTRSDAASTDDMSTSTTAKMHGAKFIYRCLQRFPLKSEDLLFRILEYHPRPFRKHAFCRDTTMGKRLKSTERILRVCI